MTHNLTNPTRESRTFKKKIPFENEWQKSEVKNDSREQEAYFLVTDILWKDHQWSQEHSYKLGCGSQPDSEH
jgi:hypothetical protein